MTPDKGLTVENRILQLLQHLGIRRAHFAGRTPSDWTGLATISPEVFASLTLVGPASIDPRMTRTLGSRLLVINGEKGANANRVQRAVEKISGASLLTLPNYAFLGWSDAVADRPNEIGTAILDFLARIKIPAAEKDVSPTAVEGEISGISYRIRGAGPPLVLLPLFLAPSQWEPLIPRLSQKYRTIILGGTELGAVAILESRGRAVGYLQMMRTLMDETRLRPAETVLEVGCGSGVLDRWLAHHTGRANPIVGVDINRYLLQEAGALSRKEGLEETIEYREGNAEALSFRDNSFDVTLSVTVIEEVDAKRLLAEMVRVTTRGGRVAVIARSVDIPFLMNLPLRTELKAKVEAPGMNFANIEEHGCGDAGLYRRLYQAGLTQVKMLPQFAAFDRADATVVQWMQNSLLSKLSQDEAEEWNTARAQAEADGTFFMAWPHHCAVGTKP
jgi:ubiquinone/menaquinone biosynthesis C-methylase UbiE